MSNCVANLEERRILGNCEQLTAFKLQHAFLLVHWEPLELHRTAQSQAESKRERIKEYTSLL